MYINPEITREEEKRKMKMKIWAEFASKAPIMKYVDLGYVPQDARASTLASYAAEYADILLREFEKRWEE